MRHRRATAARPVGHLPARRASPRSPIARGAQAGPLPDQRREPGIASEMAVDGGDVGAEIEHAADPRYDGRQRLYRGEAGARIVTSTELRWGK